MLALPLAESRVAKMAYAKALILGAALTACFAGAAYAQQKHVPSTTNPALIEEQKAQQRDADSIDRQYKSTLDRTRKSTTTATGANDPWANMRGPDPVKR